MQLLLRSRGRPISICVAWSESSHKLFNRILSAFASNGWSEARLGGYRCVSLRIFQHSPQGVMLSAVSWSVLVVYGRHASTLLVLGAWRAECGGVFVFGERALLALVKPMFTPSSSSARHSPHPHSSAPCGPPTSASLAQHNPRHSDIQRTGNQAPRDPCRKPPTTRPQAA
jgi:hypothetical protein